MTADPARVARKPFQQMRFDELPESPEHPHPYFESAAHTLDMPSALGRLRVHYREYGAGPPLLLVHGLMTDSYSWRYVLDSLGAHYRLIVPDLPGAGASSAPDRPMSAAGLASWIGEFQSALGVRGCPVVGNSLGGYLVLRCALADPEAFGAVIDIHSPALPLPRIRLLHAAMSLPGANAVLRQYIRRDTERWAHRIVHYYDETRKSREEAAHYARPLSTASGIDAFADYLRNVMSPSGFTEFTRDLRHRRDRGIPFPTPLLLVYSRRDPMVPPATGARLAALLPDARLHWLEKSSHFAHVDTPEEVSTLILEFLGRV